MKAAMIGKLQVAALVCGLSAASATGVGWGLRPAPAQPPKAKGPPDVTGVARKEESLPDPDEPEKGLPKVSFEDIQKAAASFDVPSTLSTAQPGDSFEAGVAKIMHCTAVGELKHRLNVFAAGARGGSLDVLEACARRVRDSEVALSTDPARRFEARQRFLRLAAFIVAVNRLRYDAGQVPIQDLESSRYLYLEAMLQASQATDRDPKGR